MKVPPLHLKPGDFQATGSMTRSMQLDPGHHRAAPTHSPHPLAWLKVMAGLITVGMVVVIVRLTVK